MAEFVGRRDEQAHVLPGCKGGQNSLNTRWTGCGEQVVLNRLWWTGCAEYRGEAEMPMWGDYAKGSAGERPSSIFVVRAERGRGESVPKISMRETGIHSRALRPQRLRGDAEALLDSFDWNKAEVIYVFFFPDWIGIFWNWSVGRHLFLNAE